MRKASSIFSRCLSPCHSKRLNPKCKLRITRPKLDERCRRTAENVGRPLRTWSRCVVLRIRALLEIRQAPLPQEFALDRAWARAITRAGILANEEGEQLVAALDALEKRAK